MNGQAELSNAFQILLEQLQDVLEAEHTALRALHRPSIEVAAERKVDIEARLRDIAHRGIKATPQQKLLLERIRTHARRNQLLLVHARACIQGALALATGQVMAPAYSNNPNAKAASKYGATTRAVRVNVRG
jgi:hypothetical protein